MKLTAGENSLTEAMIQRYIARKCTITINIYNCHDATQSLTPEMHNRIQTTKSQEKINHLIYNMKLFAKNEKKKIRNSNTHRQNIEPGHRN